MHGHCNFANCSDLICGTTLMISMRSDSDNPLVGNYWMQSGVAKLFSPTNLLFPSMLRHCFLYILKTLITEGNHLRFLYIVFICIFRGQYPFVHCIIVQILVIAQHCLQPECYLSFHVNKPSLDLKLVGPSKCILFLC